MFKSIIKVFSLMCLGLLYGSCTIQAMQKGARPQHGTAGTPNTWYDTRITRRGAIYFYDCSKPYYEFTNFYEPALPVVIDGFAWPTTEQYYQAGKFTDNGIRHLIRTGSCKGFKDRKPSHKSWGAWAFYIGNEAQAVRGKKRADWLQVISGLSMRRNINRMLIALRAKFGNDAHLRQMLLGTYPKILVEDSPRDGYFGTGNPKKGIAQGVGKNLLGRLLMHVRSELYTGKTNMFNEMSDFSLNYLLGEGEI